MQIDVSSSKIVAPVTQALVAAVFLTLAIASGLAEPPCNNLVAKSFGAGEACDGGGSCPAWNDSLPFGGCGADVVMGSTLTVLGVTRCVAAVDALGQPYPSYCATDPDNAIECTFHWTCTTGQILNPAYDPEDPASQHYLDVCVQGSGRGECTSFLNPSIQTDGQIVPCLQAVVAPPLKKNTKK